jgi:hypothetical protein
VRRKQFPSSLEIVSGVTRLAGDGYCPTADLFREFRGFDRRTLGKALRRAVNQGVLWERQGPDGRRYVAIASEGRRLIEARDPAR